MDFFSINTSKKNNYNSLDYTVYNYMCSNKILAAVFLIIHLVGYQLLGLLVQQILYSSGMTDTDTLRIYSTFISLSLICIVYLVITSYIKPLKDSFIKTRFSRLSVLFAFTILLIFVNYGGSFIISLITSPFTTSSSNNQEDLVKLFSVQPVIMIFTTSILAPIAEEYAYRLGLVSLFGQKRKILSIICSGILFGLIHFDFTTIGHNTFLNEFMNLFSYIFAGLLFAYAYVRSESALPSIGTHFVNNILASVLIITGFGG